MSAREPWRFRCTDCGSVALYLRVEAGGYRCEGCGHMMAEEECVDAKAAT